MSSVSEPLTPTSASVDSTDADSTSNAADASLDASPATDSTTTDSTPTDNPTDPALVTAGIATVTPDEAPAPPRPKKKRRWLRAVGWVTGAAVIVTMTGATGYVADHHHVHIGVYPAPASSYVEPTPSPTTTAPARNHSGDLRRFLLARPPSAKKWFNRYAPTGTMSLKQLASMYDDPKSGADYLKSSGFKNAATVLWEDKAGNFVEIRLYRFQTDSEAFRFYQDEVSSVPTDKDTRGTHGLTVSRASGAAMTFTGGKKAKDGTLTSKGIAYRGDIFIDMWITQKAPESEPLVAGLVYQQWIRL